MIIVSCIIVLKGEVVAGRMHMGFCGDTQKREILLYCEIPWIAFRTLYSFSVIDVEKLDADCVVDKH